ncbi:MAG: LysR substrate-binding domain-containing protein [Holophaga sp.]|nr:LysR substrate-binding domain-containing protein [Holophaga sp.]
MELRLLRYFVAVAEELHFSRAAVRLHMAQPPLSQQIRRLEQELGVQLLNRTRRQVALTEPGRDFLASAQEILRQVEGAVARVQRLGRGEAGRLAIAMISSVAYQDTLPRILRAYRARFPAVSITLQEMNAEEQLAALREDRIQVGFLRTPIADSGMAVTSFFRDQLVAVLPAEHPLAARKRIPLKALSNDLFIVVPRSQALGGLDLVLQSCFQAGFTPRVAQEARELQSLIGFVAAGFGVSLVPATARKLMHSGVAFVALAPPVLFIEVAAVYKARNDSPLLAAFLGILREATAPGRP